MVLSLQFNVLFSLPFWKRQIQPSSVFLKQIFSTYLGRFIPSGSVLHLSMSSTPNPSPIIFDFPHSTHSPHPKSSNPTFTTHKTLISCKESKSKRALEEKKKVVFVDYDNGKHQVSTHVSGLRKADIPKHYRLRVEADRFQKDWSVSEVVERLLKLNHWDDVEGLLNRWVGRFSRKNFPLLIRVRNGANWIQFELKWNQCNVLAFVCRRR